MIWLKYILLGYLTLLLIYLGYLIIRNAWHRFHGGRTCGTWVCPDCKTAFGKSALVATFRQGDMVKGKYFEGAVMRCPQCQKEHWFYWNGRIFNGPGKSWSDVTPLN